MDAVEKNRVIKWDHFVLQGNRDKIFKVMDCYENSPVYEAMVEIYEKVIEEARAAARPQAVLYIENNNGEHNIEEFKGCEQVIYNCLTIGEEIQSLIASKFEEGDYLEGMMLDCIADYFTFEICDEVYKLIYDYLEVNNMGSIRLSPGERGFAIEHHKLLEEKLHMKDEIGVRLSESCMLYPVKSISSVFIVDGGIQLRRKLHECKYCSDLICKWRQVEDEGSDYRAG